MRGESQLGRLRKGVTGQEEAWKSGQLSPGGKL